jgi:chloramphenicol-sensitive protein RarD
MQRYYLSALSAFLIWGFMPLVVRELQTYFIGSILYYRIIFSVVLLLLGGFLFLSKQWKTTYTQFSQNTSTQKSRVIGLTVLSGILLTINWVTFMYVLNYVDTQTGAFAYTLCPILTSILGFVILHEKLNQNQWFAIFLCAISCALMATGTLRNFLFSFFIGLTYAFYLVLQRFLKEYDKIVLLTLQLTIALICILPFSMVLNEQTGKVLDSHFFIFVAIIALFFTVVPLFLNLYALKVLTSGTVGVFMYLNPLTGMLLAFFYFGEKTSLLQVGAYILIAIAIIIYNIPAKVQKIIPS